MLCCSKVFKGPYSCNNLHILLFYRSKLCMDSNGKQLVFAVKKGTDSTLLWKGTVRIACVKLDPVTKKVDTYRFLNLGEFLRVSKMRVPIIHCTHFQITPLIRVTAVFYYQDNQ